MLVAARRFGQLGNRLLRAAHLIAAAIEHGHGFADLSFGEYAADFEGTRADWLCRFPTRRGLFRPRPLAASAARRLGKLGLWLGARTGWPRVLTWDHPDRNYSLDAPEFDALARRPGLLLFEGWAFRTASLLAHVDALRRHFAPAPEHARAVAALHAELRRRADVIVGVHLRRGDYARFQGGRFHWEQGAYVALARRVEALFAGRRVLFLVASNEAVDPATWAGVAFARSTGHPVEDLFALAGCDYAFGPPSTFSMWASFYGRVPLWLVGHPEERPTLASFDDRHFGEWPAQAGRST